MNEATFWAAVRKGLSAFPRTDLERVENGCKSDTPDVNYCIDGREGWIELKHVREAPKRAATVVKVDHYTPGQRLWAIRRASCGGLVWLLIRIGDETFLLNGAMAARYLGTSWTMADIRQHAAYRSQRLVEWGCLRTALKGD